MLCNSLIFTCSLVIWLGQANTYTYKCPPSQWVFSLHAYVLRSWGGLSARFVCARVWNNRERAARGRGIMQSLRAQHAAISAWAVCVCECLRCAMCARKRRAHTRGLLAPLVSVEFFAGNVWSRSRHRAVLAWSWSVRVWCVFCVLLAVFVRARDRLAPVWC